MNAKQLKAAIAQLDAAQARATARTLEADDIRRADRALRSLRRYAKRIGAEEAIVEVDGGAVPNGYNRGMGGEATHVRVHALGANIVRGRARSVSYGDDKLFRGMVPAPDAAAPAAEWPVATILGKKIRPRKDAGRLFFDIPA